MILMPSAETKRAESKSVVCEKEAIRYANGIATKVPMVPGAFGDKPLKHRVRYIFANKSFVLLKVRKKFLFCIEIPNLEMCLVEFDEF